MLLMDWNQIKHFTPDENWGDPVKMDESLILKLDALRGYVDRKIIIHSGYNPGGHSKDSQHYLGKAVDIHIEGMGIFEQYLAAERFSFNGLGIYPLWNSPGLHLDTRTLGKYETKERWMRVDGNYIGLTKENIIKYALG